MTSTHFDGNTVFDLGVTNKEFAVFFTGTCYRSDLTQEQMDISNITFSPSARTKWHYHHSGEILLITGGTGWHQIEGQPAQRIKAGDVINVKAGVKHWHGASKDNWLSHIALTVPQDNTQTDILDAVSDEEYNQLT